MTNPFSRKPVLEKDLGRIANSIRKYLNGMPDNYDLAIEFPLSQVIDPQSAEAKSLTGLQYSATIPFAVLTPFPKGKLLLAIYDHNSEDPLVSEILKKAGIGVVVKDNFSSLVRGDIRAALGNTTNTKCQPYERLSVGYEQYMASKIIDDRLKRFRDNSTFILFHEVRASSVAKINTTLDTDLLECWTHATKTSFDCLVVSKAEMLPLLAIEYDGEYFHDHDNKEQKRKDNLKNKFCNLLSLPLIRINKKYLDQGGGFDRYRASGFLQEVALLPLWHSMESYIDIKQFIRDLNAFTRDKNKGKPEKFTADECRDEFLSSGERWTDECFTQMEMSYEKDRRKIEYKVIYGAEPDIKFSTDTFGRLLASLKVLPIGLKKSMLLQTPVSIKVEIYGVNIDNFDDRLRSFMGNYLLDLANAAGKLQSQSA